MIRVDFLPGPNVRLCAVKFRNFAVSEKAAAKTFAPTFINEKKDLIAAPQTVQAIMKPTAQAHGSMKAIWWRGTKAIAFRGEKQNSIENAQSGALTG